MKAELNMSPSDADKVYPTEFFKVVNILKSGSK